MARSKGKDDKFVVKKYANRRLYDTARSSYITLDDISEMIRDDLDFVVYDAKTGEDLTRSVLAQIVLDQESEQEAMLPTDFMRKIIGLYGDSMQGVFPEYLEQAMELFTKNQEQFRDQFNKSLTGMFSVEQIQEINQRNMQMMQKTMNLFQQPFSMPGVDGETPAPSEQASEAEKIEAEIKALQEKLNKLK